ncbi:hypothetical protein E2C01_024255 [Portunus trituberculatus]|uniref:Uncharacterized protein n=1 Tax=Portunus trituberculatus TaxID=210409 RepID=A0A5B7EDC5_PORTR|nr:hypothetical protein [Portunus trituberculatus]
MQAQADILESGPRVACRRVSRWRRARVHVRRMLLLLLLLVQEGLVHVELRADRGLGLSGGGARGGGWR